mmetsp:Transcript_6439/g.18434  ORF Transcript_6439/g.18434 Transcript_6439/m.18434 type:complete len:234 (-) Transcript_6439:166-867(-)
METTSTGTRLISSCTWELGSGTRAARFLSSFAGAPPALSKAFVSVGLGLPTSSAKETRRPRDVRRRSFDSSALRTGASEALDAPSERERGLGGASPMSSSAASCSGGAPWPASATRAAAALATASWSRSATSAAEPSAIGRGGDSQSQRVAGERVSGECSGLPWGVISSAKPPSWSCGKSSPASALLRAANVAAAAAAALRCAARAIASSRLSACKAASPECKSWSAARTSLS